MVQYKPFHSLPSAEELPDSDNTPVDNELQILVPSLLGATLAWYWHRLDWFWGINMGVYYAPGKSPLVPDGFLSLGVQRIKGEKGRLSYVLWEENYVVPVLALEFVSKTYGAEYEAQIEYAQIGVLYYAIYNPDYYSRDRHQPFEVYRLVEGNYEIQAGNPVWLPEIGLGIGTEQGIYRAWEREWLYWYDNEGNRLPVPEEVAQQERQRAKRLATQLRQMGIDPDKL